MKRGQALAAVAFALAGALSVAFCMPARAGNLRHGVVYYVPTGDPQLNATVADRYDLGLIEESYGADAAAVKALDPGFKWFVYNSGTDNYVTGPTGEHDAIATLALARGWDPEDAYLHFWDDTQVTIQNQSVFVPGWGGGSAATRAEARVPVYYSDLSRRVVNFTGRGRILHKLVMLDRALGQPFPGTNLYPDGIFLDNSAYKLWNTGTITNGGGHVAEIPGMPVVGSAAFLDWFWFQNYGPFLGELKDTLETSASWSGDGKRKELMINAGNVWDDTYVTFDTADHLCLEYQYSPVRNHGSGAVMTAWQRDVMAANAGISSYYISKVATSRSGVSGSYTYEEAKLGSLAWYLVTRTAATSLFLLGTFDPTRPDWETLTWSGALDVADDSLGAAVGDPYVLSTGTDPAGNAYDIVAREYQNGLALVRNLGAWNQNLGPETAAPVTLPAEYRPLAVDGTPGSSVTQITLRNGEGAVFLAGAGEPGEEPPPPPPPPPPVPAAVEPDPGFLLLGTSPVPGANDMPGDASIRVLFSHPVDGPPASSWLTASGSVSGARSGLLEIREDRLVFVPGALWQPGETVTVRVSGAIRSVDGALLDVDRNGVGGAPVADDYTFQFTVVP